MAIKRKLGVEFLSEGFKVQEERDIARQTAAPFATAASSSSVPGPEAVDRKRAFLTYGPALLRVLAINPADPMPPRPLFERVQKDMGTTGVFPDFELALAEAYEQRFVETAGRDAVYGDPLYAITRYGLSVTPKGA